MVKQAFLKLTGYWLHRASTLPVGSDFPLDLQRAGLRTPELIFDVGANVGQTYQRFRRDYPSASIVCFEPVSQTCDALRATIAGDSLARAECLALGAASGRATIGVSEQWSVLNSLTVRNSAPDVREETILVDTIDNYCRTNDVGHIDLLKIDTEGYELDVLRGAAKTSVSAVLCEVGFDRANPRNTFFTDVAEFLADRSFRFYAMHDVTHYPGFEQPSFANALFIRYPLVPTLD